MLCARIDANISIKYLISIAYYEWITNAGFDLDRGRTRDIEHLSTERLKQITGYHEQQEELKGSLERENRRLKKENKSLKEYIDTTFQVIKEYIGYPINIIKSLVDFFLYLKHSSKKIKDLKDTYDEELEEHEIESETTNELNEKE